MGDKQATKKQDDHDTETPFERFEAFAKRLLAVPKQELEAEIVREKLAKSDAKEAQREGSG